VVFAHSLFPRFDDAWRIVERYDNVWLEMTNVCSSFWDRRYVLKEYDTEKRLLLEGIGPISTARRTRRLGESVRERLVGGTAERFVRTFWPDFDSRNAKKA